MLTVCRTLLVVVAVLLTSCDTKKSQMKAARAKAIETAILERLTSHLTRSPGIVGGDPSAIHVSVQMKGDESGGKAAFECSIRVPESSQPPASPHVHLGFWSEHLNALTSLQGTAEFDSANKPTRIQLSGQTTAGPFEYDLDPAAGHFSARYTTPTGVVLLTKIK